MDRRLFLTGLLGVAGAAALTTVVRPGAALAGVPNGKGILDELDGPQTGFLDDETPAGIEEINHRPGHRRRRHRRRIWRRVCRRFRRHGRTITQCTRRRVWVWYWAY